MSNSEGVRNPISKTDGKLALITAFENLENNLEIDKETLKNAVKYSLQLLHHQIPGKSVELRIPPFAAVSIIEGKNHKRGTPPAIIEISAPIWIELVKGLKSWNQAIDDGLISASGPNTDLSPYLPIGQTFIDE